MVSRKRGRDEMESSEPVAELSLLQRLRNMWEFANLMQYIFIFGKAVKIDDDFTIQDLETECLKAEPSETLADIGLKMLKAFSWHRGLTREMFDDHARRQYERKAPSRNPFGTEEPYKKFNDLDVFDRIRVLVQLSRWTLAHPEHMRERMEEKKDSEMIQWRMEEIGYDKEERLYFVLDDNRLYRRTDPALPSPSPIKPKSKSKNNKATARASKRRKTVDADELANGAEGLSAAEKYDALLAEDPFGGRKWECLAVALDQYSDFLETIRRSRDLDEKALYQYLSANVVPIIEKAEESQRRRMEKREKELMNLEKLTTAKRSSRIASKQDKEREEREGAEAEAKRKADLLAAKRDQEMQKEREQARESRMMTREQRLKELEFKRILHEEELANLSEGSKKLENGEARVSERHLKIEKEKRKKEWDALAEDDEWTFDCSVCGVHGQNVDDGSHSVACEKCNVWQHSACLGISQSDAEKEDFNFLCDDCKRREEDAKKPKIPSLKFRVGPSSSPPQQKSKHVNALPGESKKRKSDDATGLPPMKKFRPVGAHPDHINGQANGQSANNSIQRGIMNGPTLSPQGRLPRPPYHSTYGNQASTPHGPRSPAQAQACSSSYIQHMPPQSGYSSIYRPASPHSQSSLPNGVMQPANIPQGAGWSARYSPYPFTPAPTQRTAQPHTQGSFVNTFDRQQPSSSHPVQHTASPMNNAPTMSSTQGNINTTYAKSTQPHITNGILDPCKGILPPPVVSPAKQQSSPPQPSMLPPSSSPANAPPLKQYTQPKSALSPTKQPSPPPATHLPSSSPLTHPPLQQHNQLPPAFSPTKQQCSPPPPTLPPPASSPIVHPPLRQNLQATSGLSPEKHSPPRSAECYVGGGRLAMPPVEQLSPTPKSQGRGEMIMGASGERLAVNGADEGE